MEKKYDIGVTIDDGRVAVQCEHGEIIVSDLTNPWLWVLGAIAFPEENVIHINDVRKHRQPHQKDMTTQKP